MLYLIKLEELHKKTKLYTIFETHTESVMNWSEYTVRELVAKYGMKLKNMDIDKDKISLNEWPHKIRQKSDDLYDTASMYVLLSKINDQWFKLVRHNGIVIYRDDKELKRSIQLGEVANCSFDEVTNEYKSIDTYNIKSDIKFKQYIELKYTQFKAKAALLGIDMQFNYNIEGREVKIEMYTGHSKKVIVPNFVTTINVEAFSSRDITELTLNEGLKYIGRHAFEGNKISQVVIPKSVVFICSGAFAGNTELTELNGQEKDTIKKLSDKTILL